MFSGSFVASLLADRYVVFVCCLFVSLLVITSPPTPVLSLFCV